MSELQGLIVAAHGRHYLAHADGKALQCVTRGKKSDVATGDRVRLTATSPDQAVIDEILPRDSLLYRSDQYKSKLLAANVTQLFIVVATEPGFSDDLISRSLVAASAAGITARLVRPKTTATRSARQAGAL
jgi:ribosome biogenesis GTPase